MNISKIMMSATLIAAALGVIPALAVTSSDADIQTLNVEVSASTKLPDFKLDPVRGLKPGFNIGDTTLARGTITGDEPQQYGVVFDTPGPRNAATILGQNDSSHILKVRLWVTPEIDHGATQLGDWYIFPTAQEVKFEVRLFNAADVKADVYKIMMYATVYTP